MLGKNIDEIRKNLKLKVTKDLAVGLDEISRILATNSERYNEILQLMGRSTELNSQINNGTIDEKDKEVQINKIRKSTLDILSILSPSDLAAIDVSNREIKLLIEYTEEIALLNLSIERLKKEKEFLITETKNKDFKISEMEKELLKLENKLKRNEKLPVLLIELQKFHSDYSGTIEYFPMFDQTISTLKQEIFFDEVVVKRVLGYFDRTVMRDLEYLRQNMLKIQAVEENQWTHNHKQNFLEIEGFEKRYRALLLFCKSFDSDVSIIEIREQEEKARFLFEQVVEVTS